MKLENEIREIDEKEKSFKEKFERRREKLAEIKKLIKEIE